jgi:predicted RNA-binding protein with PUA domain
MRASFLRPLLLAAAALGAPALGAADGPSLSTPLVWKPTSILSATTEKLNLTPFVNVRIAFLPLVDNRKDKGLLGENREKPQVRFVQTPDAVAPFVSAHLLDLMKEPGLPVTDKADGATLVVSGELLRFSVIEKDTYEGEFRALLQIRSGDKLVWKGMAVGRATRFGRSYKLENYHEVLSDCLVEAASRLLSDEVFVSVLAGKAMVVAIPAAN